MTVQFNPNLTVPLSVPGQVQKPLESLQQTKQPEFGQALMNSLRQVNQDQTDANTSIVDLLSGKQQDINTVVASVAKADMSFKLLVGVRNKLVEAYKETMKMQV